MATTGSSVIDPALDAFVAHIAQALDSVGVPYVIVGSYASSSLGRARATQDVDIVISLQRIQVHELARHFPEDRYYFDEQMALDALRCGSMFNVIDLESSWKADFIIAANALSHEEIERAWILEVGGHSVRIATAEDTIIAKLDWSKRTGSERQLEDVAGVLMMRAGELDVGRIDAWVARLGLEPQWARAQTLAKP